MSRLLRLSSVVLASGAVALAGCGGSDGAAGASGAGGSGAAQLVVSAAASLQAAFTRYGEQFTAAKARFSFGGSDVLAAQIEQGLRPDVFASANMTLPETLYARGLAQRPVEFAANRLVLAVPAGSHKVRSLADLERPGTSVAIGSPTVPIGIYTREVLSRLSAAPRSRILANVRSEEPDVNGIVGKLTEGALDAGFTYVTDVRASGGKLRAIALPPTLRPIVAYGIAVVKGSPNATIARGFIAGLLHGAGRAALLSAGFVAPARTA